MLADHSTPAMLVIIDTAIATVPTPEALCEPCHNHGSEHAGANGPRDDSEHGEMECCPEWKADAACRDRDCEKRKP